MPACWWSCSRWWRAGWLAWLRSPAALEFVAREIGVRSGGALQLEGTQGSLLSTVQARSLTYRAGAFSLVAEDVALEWTPAALWSSTVAIRGLGARRITVTLPPASGPTPLPATLVLPFEVAIDHAAVGEVVLIDGDARRELHGVTLGYRGGATAHQVHDVAVTMAAGRFSGFMRVDATAPFAIGGAVDFVAAEGWKGLAARALVGGRLDALDLALDAAAGEATARGYAQVTPFADALLPTATIELGRLDLAVLATGLPTTELDGNLTASVAADGSIAGTLTATNASAGPVDRDRLPLTALAARYAFADGTLTLSDLVGEAGPRARARGSARIPLAQSGSFGSWRLALARVDLSRLHSALVATELSGRFNAVLSASGQELDGDLAQDNLGLVFAATVRGDAIDVSRLRARAGSGEFVGRGRLDLAGARRFAVEGKASGLDPSQLGRFPSARLDGELTATGVTRAGVERRRRARARPDVALPRRAALRRRPRTDQRDDAAGRPDRRQARRRPAAGERQRRRAPAPGWTRPSTCPTSSACVACWPSGRRPPLPRCAAASAARRRCRGRATTSPSRSRPTART